MDHDYEIIERIRRPPAARGRVGPRADLTHSDLTPVAVIYCTLTVGENCDTAQPGAMPVSRRAS